LAVNGDREIALGQSPVGTVFGWSPVGNRILFLSNRRGTWDAFATQVVDGKVVGETELVKEGIGEVWPMGFTRSGAFYYEVDNFHDDVFVATLDPHTGKVQGKPVKASERFQGRNKYPDWSPDGKSLAYVSHNMHGFYGVLHIRNMETGADQELKTEADPVTGPRWSPDGNSFLAYGVLKEQMKLCRIDAHSGKAAPVFQGADPEELQSAEWSPDGKSIFYQTTNVSMVVRYDLGAGAETKIQIPTGAQLFAIAPDGKQLAFKHVETNYSTLSVMPIGGGEVSQLAKVGPPDWKPFVEGPYWTPDSRYVLFARGKLNDSKTMTLWRVPAAGGEPEDLGLEMEQIMAPGISSDGRHIAFFSGGSGHERWVMENFLPRQTVAAK